MLDRGRKESPGVEGGGGSKVPPWRHHPSVPGATVITVRLPQGRGEEEEAGGVQLE